MLMFFDLIINFRVEDSVVQRSEIYYENVAAGYYGDEFGVVDSCI